MVQVDDSSESRQPVKTGQSPHTGSIAARIATGAIWSPRKVERLQGSRPASTRYGHRDADRYLDRLPPWLTRQRTLRPHLGRINLDKGTVLVHRAKAASTASTVSPAMRSGLCARCGGEPGQPGPCSSPSAVAQCPPPASSGRIEAVVPAPRFLCDHVIRRAEGSPWLP